jgi:hypothetical protein
MSLAAAPTFTPGSAGNLLPTTTATYGTPVTVQFYIGVSGQSGAQGSITTGSALGGRLQVWNTGPATITAGAGVTVNVYSTSDGTTFDTTPYGGSGFLLATVASASQYASFDLPPGQYTLSLSNTDSAHTTTVKATLGTIA